MSDSMMESRLLQGMMLVEFLSLYHCGTRDVISSWQQKRLYDGQNTYHGIEAGDIVERPHERLHDGSKRGSIMAAYSVIEWKEG